MRTDTSPIKQMIPPPPLSRFEHSYNELYFTLRSCTGTTMIVVIDDTRSPDFHSRLLYSFLFSGYQDGGSGKELVNIHRNLLPMYRTAEVALTMTVHDRAHYALPTQNLKDTKLFSVVYLMTLSNTEDYTVKWKGNSWLIRIDLTACNLWSNQGTILQFARKDEDHDENPHPGYPMFWPKHLPADREHFAALVGN
jgi:hypothetical protein